MRRQHAPNTRATETPKKRRDRVPRAAPRVAASLGRVAHADAREARALARLRGRRDPSKRVASRAGHRRMTRAFRDAARRTHADSSTVDADCARSLWAFTSAWREKDREATRVKLKRVIDGAVNAHAPRDLKNDDDDDDGDARDRRRSGSGRPPSTITGVIVL